jgi:hydrogenase nickel incorporation protein HypA/HybF
MHEFSISQEIVQAVLNSVKENKVKKVFSVQLEIGEMALLNVEQVTFWIHELFKKTEAEGAKVKVRVIRARIQCVSCGYQGGISYDQKDPFQHFISYSCPQCGSFEIKVEKGRECMVKRIQASRD